MFKIQNKTEGKVQRVLSPPPTTINILHQAVCLFQLMNQH